MVSATNLLRELVHSEERVIKINLNQKNIKDKISNSLCGATRLLSNGALVDMAVRELQAAASEPGASWAPPEMARAYQDIGRYDRGIEVMKRSTPNYFAVDIPDLPRPYWKRFFRKRIGAICASIRWSTGSIRFWWHRSSGRNRNSTRVRSRARMRSA